MGGDERLMRRSRRVVGRSRGPRRDPGQGHACGLGPAEGAGEGHDDGLREEVALALHDGLDRGDEHWPTRLRTEDLDAQPWCGHAARCPRLGRGRARAQGDREDER